MKTYDLTATVKMLKQEKKAAQELKDPKAAAILQSIIRKLEQYLAK